MCLICFLSYLSVYFELYANYNDICRPMITKINTINVFVFFLLNKKLNIVFFHQEGEGRKRGGGGQSKQRYRNCHHFLGVTLQFQFNYNAF